MQNLHHTPLFCMHFTFVETISMLGMEYEYLMTKSTGNITGSDIAEAFFGSSKNSSTSTWQNEYTALHLFENMVHLITKIANPGSQEVSPRSKRLNRVRGTCLDKISIIANSCLFEMFLHPF